MGLGVRVASHGYGAPGCRLPPRAARDRRRSRSAAAVWPSHARAWPGAGGPRMRHAGRERGRRDPDWAATAVAGRAEVGGREKVLLDCLLRLKLAFYGLSRLVGCYPITDWLRYILPNQQP